MRCSSRGTIDKEATRNLGVGFPLWRADDITSNLMWHSSKATDDRGPGKSFSARFQPGEIDPFLDDNERCGCLPWSSTVTLILACAH